jgi:hypothetical protein
VKLLPLTWLQSRSGGGDGMQKSGYAGSHPPPPPPPPPPPAAGFGSGLGITRTRTFLDLPARWSASCCGDTAWKRAVLFILTRHRALQAEFEFLLRDFPPPLSWI